MGNKCLDPIFVKFYQPVPESELCPKAPVFAIIYIAGNEEKGNLVFYAEINQRVVGVESSRAERFSDNRAICSNPFERAIQMEIRCMNKCECITSG
jgi:hypothetical protein